MANECWLLCGQSNMVGEGKDVTPVYANASRIFRYQQYWDAINSVPMNSANLGWGSWGPSSDPLHSDPVCGVGPGNSFADRMIALRGDPSLNIGLVPCGWSGSDVTYKWAQVYRNVGGAFSSAAARGRAASAWGPVRGMIYYQGETEAQQPPYPWFWMEAVYSIHQAMKAELGTSDLLMVVVVLGPDPQVSTYPSWSTIQQYVRQMAGVNPLVGIADASNLAAIPTNNIHITAASAVTLGQRIAASAFALGQGKGFW